MEWFILSRDMHVLCAPSTDSPNSLPIFDDKQTILLSNNTVVSTYDFTVRQKHEDAGKLQMGNYIVFKDKYKKTRMYTLISFDGDDLTRTWHAEDIGLDLIAETANKWDYTGESHPIEWYLSNFVLDDSGWTIGINEVANLTRGLKFEGQSDSKLKRLGDIANQFDGAEIDFTIEMNGSTVTKQVVNIYKRVGTDLTQERFIDSVNLKSLQSSGSIANLCTAMLGLGGSLQNEDGSDGGQITFINELYDDGRYYSPVGQPYIFDREARQQWSRYRGYGYQDQGEFQGYIDGIYTYETSNPQELLNRTLTELKKRNTPSETYEANLLDISADVGDYVQIAHNNYNPPIYLSARVEQVENCYTASGQDTGVLGDYTRLQSQIDPRVQDLIDSLANKIKPNYTWIRYAKDDKGSGMTAAPTPDTKYIAILANRITAVPSEDSQDYSGQWKLIQGLDGKDGIPGATGADGKTSYTHFAYADNVSGTKDFSTDDPTGRSYMGVYSDFTKADSNSPSDYVWSYTKGETGPEGMQGAQGPKGDTGIPGKPGDDGKTSYTHVAYADNDKGGGFSQTPANKAYMGWYSDFTANDSTDPAKYAWSLIKGADGSNGAPGKPGADGKTPYFHQAWADSKDGKINFSTTDPTNRGYLGTYSDFTQADSTDPSKYFWTELVGAITTGAPNLVRNSGKFKDANHWAYSAGTLTLVKHPFWLNGTENLFKLTDNNTNEVTLASERFPLVRNAEYTVQFDGFHNSQLSSIDVWILSRKYGSSADFDKTQLIKGAFQLSFSNTVHTVIKFTAPSDMDEAYLRFDNNGTKTAGQNADLYLTDIKVARENRPSPWSPAPEDTQEQIDTINQGLLDTNSKIAAVTKVDAQATAPTNPKKGDQWWVKDANGDINAFKIWDGSKWVDSMIQQSLLNIVTLNSVTLNSATINSPDIKAPFDYTGPDKNHFQGVTQIKDGAVNITWKIPENNQTGHTSLDASGLESIIRDTDGTMARFARLQMGELGLGDDKVSGWLNEQDVYRNSTQSIQYLGGWGDWDGSNGSGLITVTRNGRMVTLSGYPKQNGSPNFSNIAQLPEWAKPTRDVNLPAMSLNSSVQNPMAAKLVVNTNGVLSATFTQQSGYVAISASYFGKDIS